MEVREEDAQKVESLQIIKSQDARQQCTPYRSGLLKFEISWLHVIDGLCYTRDFIGQKRVKPIETDNSTIPFNEGLRSS